MTNPTKFFSAALEAAEQLTQPSGTREQMLKMLEKYGAKPSELDYIGVPKFVADKPKVSRKELLDYIDENQVRPGETTKIGGQMSDEGQIERDDIAEALIRARSANREEAEEAIARFEDITGIGWDESYSDFAAISSGLVTPERIANEFNPSAPGNERLWHEAQGAAEGIWRPEDWRPEDWTGSDTRYSMYLSQPASENYTEHLVTLPIKGHKKGVFYQAPHWEEPNVLAHMRYDYDPDALRLEELQSDWLQEGRKRGMKLSPDQIKLLEDQADDIIARIESTQDRYRKQFGTGYYNPGENWSPKARKEMEDLIAKKRDIASKYSTRSMGVPRAPLANVNDWTDMLVRRALLDAAEKDVKKLRLTPGAMQDQRFSPQPGRAEYYDKIIPNIVNKYLKPYGGKMQKASPIENPNYWEESATSQYWEADLPDELKRRLLQKGKVPFFKDGGAIR